MAVPMAWEWNGGDAAFTVVAAIAVSAGCRCRIAIDATAPPATPARKYRAANAIHQYQTTNCHPKSVFREYACRAALSNDITLNGWLSPGYLPYDLAGMLPTAIPAMAGFSFSMQYVGGRHMTFDHAPVHDGRVARLPGRHAATPDVARSARSFVRTLNPFARMLDPFQGIRTSAFEHFHHRRSWCLLGGDGKGRVRQTRSHPKLLALFSCRIQTATALATAPQYDIHGLNASRVVLRRVRVRWREP
jgi:hypothetical protein